VALLGEMPDSVSGMQITMRRGGVRGNVIIFGVVMSIQKGQVRAAV
jgi:hypothetical protein